MKKSCVIGDLVVGIPLNFAIQDETPITNHHYGFLSGLSILLTFLM